MANAICESCPSCCAFSEPQSSQVPGIVQPHHTYRFQETNGKSVSVLHFPWLINSWQWTVVSYRIHMSCWTSALSCNTTLIVDYTQSNTLPTTSLLRFSHFTDLPDSFTTVRRPRPLCREVLGVPTRGRSLAFRWTASSDTSDIILSERSERLSYTAGGKSSPDANGHKNRGRIYRRVVQPTADPTPAEAAHL